MYLNFCCIILFLYVSTLMSFIRGLCSTAFYTLSKSEDTDEFLDFSFRLALFSGCEKSLVNPGKLELWVRSTDKPTFFFLILWRLLMPWTFSCPVRNCCLKRVEISLSSLASYLNTLPSSPINSLLDCLAIIFITYCL